MFGSPDSQEKRNTHNQLLDKVLKDRKSDRTTELKNIKKASENVFHTLSSFFESRSILDQKRFSEDKENKLFNDYIEEYGVKRTFRLKPYVGNFGEFFDELITGRLRKLYLHNDTPNIGVAIPGIPERRFLKDMKEESEEYKAAFNLLYSEEAKPMHRAYLTSERLENFTTFDKLYTTYKTKEDLIQYLRDAKGLERMLACAILFDEYDFNTGNFGIIEKDGEKRWVGIDFGKSHFVRAKQDIDSQYIESTLSYLLVQMKRILVRDENFSVTSQYKSDNIIENLLDKNLLFSELEAACDFFIQNRQLVESAIGRDIDLYSKIYNKEKISDSNCFSNEIVVGENTFLMSSGQFISERDQNLTLSEFYTQKAFERFEKIKQYTRELRIQMVFSITPKEYSFENYKLGKCVMEFPQEDNIINECVEFIYQDYQNLIEKIKKARDGIATAQPSDYDLPKYISKGNAEVLKGYLQYIGKYFEFTSKILDEFGKSSDEDKLRCEGLVAKKLEKIEKMLKHSTQNQGAPSVSGDTKNKKLGYEQPHKPTAVAAPNPTVVGKPQALEPKTKPVMAASIPTSYPTSREADDQLITKHSQQPQPKAPIHEPVAPSGDAHDYNQNIINKKDNEPRQNLQTEPQKPKNNSNYSYIYIGATIGLTIGLAAAYFANVAILTPVLAAVSVFIGAAIVGMFIGALLGAVVDYGVSRFLDDPKCERQQQQKIQQPCIS